MDLNFPDDSPENKIEKKPYILKNLNFLFLGNKSGAHTLMTSSYYCFKGHKSKISYKILRNIYF